MRCEALLWGMRRGRYNGVWGVIKRKTGLHKRLTQQNLF